MTTDIQTQAKTLSRGRTNEEVLALAAERRGAAAESARRAVSAQTPLSSRTWQEDARRHFKLASALERIVSFRGPGR